MRSNHNVEASGSRSVAGKLGLTPMPVEWLHAGSWCLPSGKALAEFALQAGFLAPLLLQPERSAQDKASCKTPESVNCAGAGLRFAEKNFGKGSGR